jgi:hypothetical protein
MTDSNRGCYYPVINRRTFLSHSSCVLSLPVTTKFGWVMNEHTAPKTITGTVPSDVMTLLYRARWLISDPARWQQDAQWTDDKFCILRALIAERFRLEISNHWAGDYWDENENLKEFRRDLSEYARKDGADDYAPMRDDLVRTARWVLGAVVRYEYDYRQRVQVESWNDLTTTKHRDVLGIFDQAINYERSDIYAAKVISVIGEDWLGLVEDPRIGARSSDGSDPTSIPDLAFQRVLRLQDPVNASGAQEVEIV